MEAAGAQRLGVPRPAGRLPVRFDDFTRFVVSSLYSNVLKYNKVRWDVRCMTYPTAHNGAGLNHAKLPQVSASIALTN